jgi:D-aminoacyl-tRNA deacylase
MICVVQRVMNATVAVNGKLVGQIGPGLAVLAAVHRDDTAADIQWTAQKLVGLRIFRSAGAGGEKHFDLDVKQAAGAILLVSNLTVAGATRYGRRPSLDAAASPEDGRRLFDELVKAVTATGIPTATGEFGADMLVNIANDGPVTFLLDSREARA